VSWRVKRRSPRAKRARPDLDKKPKTPRDRWNRAVRAVWTASRRDADLSQAALAAKLRLTRDIVASIEAGRRRIEFADVMLLAEALELEPETIFQRILRW
jgi:ribosome-binding protein aMBF1 (putative translation factor)